MALDGALEVEGVSNSILSSVRKTTPADRCKFHFRRAVSPLEVRSHVSWNFKIPGFLSTFFAHLPFISCRVIACFEVNIKVNSFNFHLHLRSIEGHSFLQVIPGFTFIVGYKVVVCTVWDAVGAEELDRASSSLVNLGSVFQFILAIYFLGDEAILTLVKSDGNFVLQPNIKIEGDSDAEVNPRLSIIVELPYLKGSCGHIPISVELLYEVCVLLNLTI